MDDSHHLPWRGTISAEELTSFNLAEPAIEEVRIVNLLRRLPDLPAHAKKKLLKQLVNIIVSRDAQFVTRNQAATILGANSLHLGIRGSKAVARVMVRVLKRELSLSDQTDKLRLGCRNASLSELSGVQLFFIKSVITAAIATNLSEAKGTLKVVQGLAGRCALSEFITSLLVVAASAQHNGDEA
jgi:hypothetical protein